LEVRTALPVVTAPASAATPAPVPAPSPALGVEVIATPETREGITVQPESSQIVVKRWKDPQAIRELAPLAPVTPDGKLVVKHTGLTRLFAGFGKGMKKGFATDEGSPPGGLERLFRGIGRGVGKVFKTDPQHPTGMDRLSRNIAKVTGKVFGDGQREKAVAETAEKAKLKETRDNILHIADHMDAFNQKVKAAVDEFQKAASPAEKTEKRSRFLKLNGEFENDRRQFESALGRSLPADAVEEQTLSPGNISFLHAFPFLGSLKLKVLSGFLIWHHPIAGVLISLAAVGTFLLIAQKRITFPPLARSSGALRQSA
jgi:hypothetical protein